MGKNGHRPGIILNDGSEDNLYMLIIANNITSRNPRIASILKNYVLKGRKSNSIACPEIQDVAEACILAGANILEINLQQHLDKPEVMEFAITAIQQVTDRQLCLSTQNAITLEAGIKICRLPPIINYTAIDTAQLQEIFPLVNKYQTEVVLLVSDPASPGDSQQMLERTAVLIGVANQYGIPNERLIIDPGLIHINHEQGQHHLVESMELLRAVPIAFGPGVRTTCWLSNISSGAPEPLRALIESTFLALISGLEISSVFMDVLRRENRRTLHLLRIFHNEEIYADAGISF